MTYCNNCGNELRDNATFCDKCGVRVDSVAVGRSSDALYDRYLQEFKAAKKEIRKRKNKRALFDFIVAFVFAAIAFICYSSPDRTDFMFIVMIFSAVASLGILVACIRDFIFPTRSDNRMLEQINQAYENAKMIK